VKQKLTCIILSPSIVNPIDGDFLFVNYVSQFTGPAGLLDAKINSISRVKTEKFFWLDWDDELPQNFAKLSQKLCEKDVAVAYTDELILDNRFDLATSTRRVAGQYSPAAHRRNPTLIHHLAICDTQKSLAVCAKMPRGNYAIEPLLFSGLARISNYYLPEVGYIWNRSSSGLSNSPSISVSFKNSQILLPGQK
jgi:hypothetical protein